ncbi:hypothetical protein AB0383_39130 [Amycolatopsis sp. NPDC051373]|uniref:hypothetical protein n=1 Tax=Amycolatopsis sp. NPDC051373 TaxID=3155801 RepID=UPI00344BC3EB
MDLQIDQVTIGAETEATAIDLELMRMVRYGRPVDALDPGHTALVTLRGPGTHLLRPATRAGWPVIQGINPP